MPWVSIIMFLVSFLLAKKNGASTGKAAAIGAAAGLATYYVADPANPDNLLGFGSGAKDTAGAVTIDDGASPPADGGGTGVGGVLKTGISEVGSTLRGWGPAGTLGVVAGGTALASGKIPTWMWYAAAGVAALFILK